MNKYINKVTTKINKKQIIIFIVVIILCLILIVCIQSIQESTYKEKVENNKYESANDFKTPKEFLIYSGNQYIKEEKSEEKDIDTDIYVNFKVNLFEGEDSSEEFYTDLINIVANTLSYSNYRLIDKEKELIITVMCSTEEQTVTHIYYNGTENYFSIKNSKKLLNNYNHKEGRNYEINSTIIKQLVDNDWLVSRMKFGNKSKMKHDYLVYDTFMVRNIAKKVYNIVFLKDYQEAIINGIKVGTSKEEVKEKLGKPDYEYVEIIGYKAKDIYIFFGKNTVSVYRVEKRQESYDSFINLIQEFRENGNARELVAKLTEVWDDYNHFEVEEKYINIEYALRGVKIQFNVTNEHGVIFYNNYIGEIEKGVNISEVKDKIDYELPKYTYAYVDEDLVLEAEIERAFILEEISS